MYRLRQLEQMTKTSLEFGTIGAAYGFVIGTSIVSPRRYYLSLGGVGDIAYIAILTMGGFITGSMAGLIISHYRDQGFCNYDNEGNLASRYEI